jgi:hypothetical protein
MFSPFADTGYNDIKNTLRILNEWNPVSNVFTFSGLPHPFVASIPKSA